VRREQGLSVGGDGLHHGGGSGGGIWDNGIGDMGEIQQGSCGGIVGKPAIWMIRSGAKQGQEPCHRVKERMRVMAAILCVKWRVLVDHSCTRGKHGRNQGRKGQTLKGRGN
jgi:hypothetical protein